MITKSDFEAVHQQMIEDGRAQLAPPTAEDVRAYLNGALTAEQEEEMRDRLFAYPEIARILTEPFPEPAEPGDADYLSEHEFARLWRSPKRRGAFTIWQGIAAALAVLAVLAVFDALRVRSELERPRAGSLVILTGVARGGNDATNVLYAGEAQTMYIRSDRDFPAYRVTIVSGTKTVWRSEQPLHKREEAVTVFVPANFLHKGDYDVVLYGLSGPRQEELSRNPVRVR